MKKLSLILLCFVLFGFKTNAQSSSKNISLNGISENLANSMINSYQSKRAKDRSAKKQSVWFDWTTFKRMVDLLKKERQATENTAKPTDGMRIYFAHDPKIQKKRLANTVILVSTRFLMKDNSATSKAQHEDYYSHDITDSLFLDTLAIKGKTKKKILIRRGERLYSNIKGDGNCTCAGRHFITRDTAENMVRRFGSDTMTTKSEWFELDFLDAIINSPEPPNISYDGIRFYFSKHSEFEAKIDSQEVKNKEAFIMVPTTTHGILFLSDHLDQFDCNMAQGYFKKDDDKKKKRHGFTTQGAPGGQDNGELCPDNCKPNH